MIEQLGSRRAVMWTQLEHIHDHVYQRDTALLGHECSVTLFPPKQTKTITQNVFVVRFGWITCFQLLSYKPNKTYV